MKVGKKRVARLLMILGTLMDRRCSRECRSDDGIAQAICRELRSGRFASESDNS